MSFNFKWPEFSAAFHNDAAEMLSSALNRGDKPRIIADDIRVEDINMGTVPPELEILEIGELSTDRFRGIFRLTYAGDAHLTLSTKVQANPLTRPAPSSSAFTFEDTSSVFPSSMPSRGILFAARPLVVPMQLRLSAVRLKAIVVLVVSKQKGITLVFKNDPLDSVDVSSTFDSVAVIQKYLQQEIEGQLREMFREDLPGIIHRLSQRWLSGNGKSAKSAASTSASKVNTSRPSMVASAPGVQASSPPRNVSSAALPSVAMGTSRQRTARSSSEIHLASPSTARSTPRRRLNEKVAPANVSSTPPSPRMTHRGSSIISSSPRGAKMKALATDSSNSRARSDADYSTSFGLSATWGSSGLLDEMENYDPTYGLRPDEVRMSVHQSGYSGLAKLANQINGGLRDLTIEDEVNKASQQVVVVPEELTPIHDEGENLSFEEVEAEQDTLHHLDLSEDDVPDHPASDEDEGLQGDAEGEEDFPLYSLPPLGAATSSGAIDDEASVFGSPSSVKFSSKGTRSQMYGGSRTSSVVPSASRIGPSKTNKIEYETIPAVGGGIITRPRIYHSASRVQAPVMEEDDVVQGEDITSGSLAASSTIRGPSSSRTQTVRLGSSQHQASDLSESDGEQERIYTTAVGDGSLDTLEPEPMNTGTSTYRTQLYRQQSGRIYRAGYGRHSSKGSSIFASNDSSNQRLGAIASGSADYSGWSTSRSSTAPTSTHPSTKPPSPVHSRRSNLSSPSNHVKTERAKARDSPGQASSPFKKAALANSHSMTIGASHNFMDLVNSNHTLSPFTRTLDTKGFAVRSHPVTPSTGSGGETSSSVGGIASRPLSATSSSSKQWRDPGSYFDNHRVTSSQTGGVRRRTFRLGAKSPSRDAENAAVALPGIEKRPDSTPIQHSSSSSNKAPRAHSAASIGLASQAKPASRRANSSDSGYGSSDPRRRSGHAHSERVITMGAIRE